MLTVFFAFRLANFPFASLDFDGAINITNILTDYRTPPLVDVEERKFLVSLLIVYEQKPDEHETRNYSSPGFPFSFTLLSCCSVGSEDVVVKRTSEN